MLTFNETAILPLPRARARSQHMHVREAGAYHSYSLLPSIVLLFRFVSLGLFLINGLCAGPGEGDSRDAGGAETDTRGREPGA
jgi:hypothetical protein